MLVFRSEAHLRTWLAGRTPGQTLSLAKLSELADAWWGDRLAPDWRPHAREQNQAILDRLGLAGQFWQLG
ncbi:MAG TPA: hypothetical protein VEY67_06140 [Candidatus Dormibacteraeota bacterium]|nr:hypothetical protein [Candidatus Dormibacteraeota bacterium]